MTYNQAVLKMRIESTIDDLREVETIAELNATYANWVADDTGMHEIPECLEAFGAAWDRISNTEPVNDKLRELEAQLRMLTTPAPTPTKPPVQTEVKVVRSSRKYKLLDTEVRWTTKPQVLAIMDILKAHASPGDVLDEDDIVSMMVANEAVLHTKQGGKRIWNYYKGSHNEGLLLHGNIAKA